jgi:hypothetical protein
MVGLKTLWPIHRVTSPMWCWGWIRGLSKWGSYGKRCVSSRRGLARKTELSITIANQPGFCILKIHERHHLERKPFALSFFTKKLEKCVRKTVRGEKSTFLLFCLKWQKSFHPFSRFKEIDVRKATNKALLYNPQRILIRIFRMPHESILGIKQSFPIHLAVKHYSQKQGIIVYCEH